MLGFFRSAPKVDSATLKNISEGRAKFNKSALLQINLIYNVKGWSQEATTHLILALCNGV